MTPKISPPAAPPSSAIDPSSPTVVFDRSNSGISAATTRAQSMKSKESSAQPSDAATNARRALVSAACHHPNALMGLIVIGREPNPDAFSHCWMRDDTMPIIHLHRREQRSLLAEPERRALTWIAMRLP